MALKRINCWEYMKCGREPGGKNADEFGVCPAAVDLSYDGINSGKCGGRFCWGVAGTLCGGGVQGSFAEKRKSCLDCRFYQRVRAEEGTTNLRTKFLRFISPGAKSSLLNELSSRQIRRGERFINQGQPGDTAYIVKNGSCLEIVEKDGRLHPVGHRSEGDIVGMISVLTGEPSNWHVEAETDMDVWEIHKSRFDNISRNDLDLLIFLTEIVADRFDSNRPTADRTIGKYLAADIIGRGGYSIVYKGVHTGLNMPVAIKMMRHNLAAEPDFMQIFQNEARIIAGLNHENIIKVFDIEERYRTIFVITEYLDGESLHDMLERLGFIPPNRAIGILVQLCSAMDHANRKGLIHRDINPKNIIIMPDDHVKLIDFGLACPPGTDDAHMGGAVFYLAPELFDGEPADARSDIFALGVTAYELVTGKKPFPTENIGAMMKLIQTRDIPDPAKQVPDLPSSLREFVLTACRRDPDQRYQNPRQALETLNVSPLKNKNPVCPGALLPGENRAAIYLSYDASFGREYDKLIRKIKAIAGKAGDSLMIVKETGSGWKTKSTNLHTRDYDISAATHIGRVRNQNEDRYVVKVLGDGAVLCAVADGLGGEVYGGYAADMIRQILEDIGWVPEGHEISHLRAIAKELDHTISEKADSDDAFRGMGSTFIAVVFRNKVAHWVHVGDSRFYVFRKKRLIQLTEDQTLARFLVQEGEIDPEDVPSHYSRHVMDQCIGCGCCEPESGRLRLMQGDIAILCTDGLFKSFEPNTMVSIVSLADNTDHLVDSMIRKALEKGGKDNITIVNLRCRIPPVCREPV